MIFVDTGAWFALAVLDDPDHRAAAAFLDSNREPLATSVLVAVETVNLIRFRRRDSSGHALACQVADSLWSGRSALLLPIEPEDLAEARAILQSYADTVWSLTDCSSFALMARHGIERAFAFDGNFDEFPGIHRVPATPRRRRKRGA